MDLLWKGKNATYGRMRDLR